MIVLKKISSLMCICVFLQVTTLKDFFQDDDVFIAYGPEKFSHDDFDLVDDGT